MCSVNVAISTRKVFDTMRQYSNDITFDFIDNQLKVYVRSLPSILVVSGASR